MINIFILNKLKIILISVLKIWVTKYIMSKISKL